MTLLADIIRTINLVLGAGIIGVTLVVVRDYGRTYRNQRRMAKDRKAPRWRGLLPRHVVLIGVSYIGLVVAALVATTGRIHDPLTGRAVGNLAWLSIGLWALWDMATHQRHRKADLNVMEVVDPVAEIADERRDLKGMIDDTP